MRFAPELEAEFRRTRMATTAQVNVVVVVPLTATGLIMWAVGAKRARTR